MAFKWVEHLWRWKNLSITFNEQPALHEITCGMNTAIEIWWRSNRLRSRRKSHTCTELTLGKCIAIVSASNSKEIDPPEEGKEHDLTIWRPYDSNYADTDTIPPNRLYMKLTIKEIFFQLIVSYSIKQYFWRYRIWRPKKWPKIFTLEIHVGLTILVLLTRFVSFSFLTILSLSVSIEYASLWIESERDHKKEKLNSQTSKQRTNWWHESTGITDLFSSHPAALEFWGGNGWQGPWPAWRRAAGLKGCVNSKSWGFEQRPNSLLSTLHLHGDLVSMSSRKVSTTNVEYLKCQAGK